VNNNSFNLNIKLVLGINYMVYVYPLHDINRSLDVIKLYTYISHKMNMIDQWFELCDFVILNTCGIGNII
jgi:hypothetical protein